MRNKLLYFLITLFGAATLVSGYSLVESKKVFKDESKKDDSIEQQYDDDQQPTINDQNTETNIEKVTSYRLQETNSTTQPNTNTSTPQEQFNSHEIFEAKVTLQINNKNFPIPYEEDMTAEDVMKEVQSQHPESFWYESIEYGGDLGTFVQSINGIAENNREKMYWILYINGKKSNKGISTLKLKPDDIIMWNYEKEIL
jgi:hypothetical protein